MPWDNVLLGPKPRAPLIAKALTQQDGDCFFQFQDRFDTAEQEVFLDFQRRIRVVNEQLDGYDIVMVPVGSAAPIAIVCRTRYVVPELTQRFAE